MMCKLGPAAIASDVHESSKHDFLLLDMAEGGFDTSEQVVSSLAIYSPAYRPIQMKI